MRAARRKLAHAKLLVKTHEFMKCSKSLRYTRAVLEISVGRAIEA